MTINLLLWFFYLENMKLCIFSLNLFHSHSRNHQRALDSMQASLEAESKGKAEAMRIKKKLEQDINELEVALDNANRGKAEMEKNCKRYQAHIHVSIDIHVHEGSSLSI